MKNFIFGLLLMVINFVSAQDAQMLFEEANKAYQAEAYDTAIKSYESILEKGLASSEVYYNLGNAYYKSNQIASAIYNYERALILNPINKDAKVNLAYANRSIIDTIKVVPKSIFDKFNENVLASFSYNTWAKIAVALSLLGGGLWMLFFFSIQPGIKKMYFTFGIVFSVACFISLAITVQQYTNAKNTKFAIVFNDAVHVKSAPRENASENFTLHEGTKVKVLDEVGNWQKVKIADGQVGWLLKTTIKAF